MEHKEILGRDFISPEDVMSKLSLSYSEEQLEMFQKTFPSEERIEWAKENNFFIYPGPNRKMTMGKICEIFDLSLKRKDPLDKVSTNWYLLSKSSYGTGENLRSQKSLLKNNDLYLPSAPEILWGLMIYMKANGFTPFVSVEGYVPQYFRSATLVCNGLNISLPRSFESPFVVYSSEETLPFLGALAAKKI